MDKNISNDTVSLIPLGGVGTVTKNMYLYEYNNEILIVDCGIGFPDASTPGVDFLIPDISYLKKVVKTGKRIVGMVLTHGHEDHIGGVPFVLDQLPSFPIYATRFTTALTNEKLKDFGLRDRVKETPFSKDIRLGAFTISFIHVTHSVLDTSHIFIKTPIGNFYHGSDFKFDLSPVDGEPSDLQQIVKVGNQGILCLLSDCLGSEHPGHSIPERTISDRFEDEFRKAKGKIFISTYSSNVSRMNQAIEMALKFNRKVCFIGRSFLKVRDIAKMLSYMKLPPNMEIKPQEVRRMNPSKVMILAPGSQAQEFSALVRIASGNDSNIRIDKGDTVIFSADPIPGNELNINALIDTISKRQARVIYSDISTDFHVSGHGLQNDIKLLLSLTKPKNVLPIGGQYKHMVAFKELARSLGYKDKNILLPENGQEMLFSRTGLKFGKKIKLSTVYVDQVTGDEVESFIILDKKKIAKEGIMVIIAEISPTTGDLVETPDIIARGFVYPEKDAFAKNLGIALKKALSTEPGKPPHFGVYRKLIQRTAERLLFRERREPLIIPIIVEG